MISHDKILSTHDSVPLSFSPLDFRSSLLRLSSTEDTWKHSDYINQTSLDAIQNTHRSIVQSSLSNPLKIRLRNLIFIVKKLITPIK